ncbi:hypothetical protein B4166_0326 [Caldibacillus thermoamylovorans]|uniref:Uncharacterized protein n=1 Tax=Caldibacillus thermoamylovorans TaxID=35841 RepID=A0ABD4A4A1_9BACI|nr:hypothetical protein B4166_0326 [Caldibacillus thermoamylovorans]KIO71915.1 hypothetical protein B4167_0330 [Caldibacillus thermoamylovorans]
MRFKKLADEKFGNFRSIFGPSFYKVLYVASLINMKRGKW